MIVPAKKKIILQLCLCEILGFDHGVADVM